MYFWIIIYPIHTLDCVVIYYFPHQWNSNNNIELFLVFLIILIFSPRFSPALNNFIRCFESVCCCSISRQRISMCCTSAHHIAYCKNNILSFHLTNYQVCRQVWTVFKRRYDISNTISIANVKLTLHSNMQKKIWSFFGR